MRFVFALLLCLIAAPVHAADNYDVLFGKTMWLNSSRPVTAEDAKGRAVLLDFWTYGCINCMHVIPELKALEKEFGDKLLVIGVHSAKFVGERDSDRIQAAAKRFGITHPVINDSEFTVWKAFGVKAWPTLVLLGPDGKEVGRYAGEGNREAIETELRKMNLFPSSSQEKTKHSSSGFPTRVKYARTKKLGHLMFLADVGHNDIFKLNLTKYGNSNSSEVRYAIKSWIGGAMGTTNGKLSQPHGIAITNDGMYIADTGAHVIRYYNFEDNLITTVAGTGERGLYPQVKDREAVKTPIASPWDVAMMADGKTLVIAMAGLHQLWTYDTEKKTVSTLAGTGSEGIKDGPAAEATLAQPSGLAIDGDAIYFVDAESSALRVLKDGQVKTLIGTGLFDYGMVDGKYPEAMLQHPQGLSIYNGKIYISDTYNNAIRVYDIASATLSTLVKGIVEPTDALAIDNTLFIVGSGDKGGLYTWDMEKKILLTGFDHMFSR